MYFCHRKDSLMCPSCHRSWGFFLLFYRRGCAIVPSSLPLTVPILYHLFMMKRWSSHKRAGALQYAAKQTVLRGRQTVNICLLGHLLKISEDKYLISYVSNLSTLPDRISGTISNTPKDSKTDFPEMESSRSQRSLCWSDGQPSPPQPCFSPPADLSLPFSNNLTTTIPLHNNNSKNSRALHSLQRRVHFKVKGNKSAKRT